MLRERNLIFGLVQKRIISNEYLEDFVLITSISLVVNVNLLTVNLLETTPDQRMKLIFRIYVL